jgi:hypothetical protein
MPVPSAAIRRKTAARTGGSRGKRVTSTRTRALLTYAAGAGPREIADKFSATYQVAVAARTIREVAELAERARDAGKRLTTLTLDTEVRFATPGEREAFANELVEAVTRLAAKYHHGEAAGGRTFRVFVGAHPAMAAAKKESK